MNFDVQEDPSTEWKNECYKYNHACHEQSYFRKISVWVHELICYLPEQFKYLPEFLKNFYLGHQKSRLNHTQEKSPTTSMHCSFIPNVFILHDNQRRNTERPSKLQPIKNFQF